MITYSSVYNIKILKEDIHQAGYFRDNEFIVVLVVPTLKEGKELEDSIIRKFEDWNKNHS